MRARYLKGVTTGMMIGFAAGMMLIPEADRSTRKKMRKSARMVRNTAEDIYDYMKNIVR